MIDQQSFIYTKPGYNPIAYVNGIQFDEELQVPAELPLRELHMGWRTAGIDYSSLMGAKIEIELVRTNAIVGVLRFWWDAYQATQQSTPASCVPAFTVCEYSGTSATSADFDPTRVQFQSSRALPLAPDCLLWPLAYDGTGDQPAAVIVTAPLRFRAAIDRVRFSVKPMRTDGAWKPALLDPLVYGNFTVVGAIVSKAM